MRTKITRVLKYHVWDFDIPNRMYFLTDKLNDITLNMTVDKMDSLIRHTVRVNSYLRRSHRKETG